MLCRWGLIAIVVLGPTTIEPRNATAEALGKTFSIDVFSIGYYHSGQLAFADDGTFLYEDTADTITGTYTETVDETSGASQLIAGGAGEVYEVTFSALTLDTTSNGDTPTTLIMGFGFSNAGLPYLFSGSSIAESTSSEASDPNSQPPDSTAPDSRTNRGTVRKSDRQRRNQSP